MWWHGWDNFRHLKWWFSVEIVLVIWSFWKYPSLSHEISKFSWVPMKVLVCGFSVFASSGKAITTKQDLIQPWNKNVHLYTFYISNLVVTGWLHLNCFVLGLIVEKFCMFSLFFFSCIKWEDKYGCCYSIKSSSRSSIMNSRFIPLNFITYTYTRVTTALLCSNGILRLLVVWILFRF